MEKTSLLDVFMPNDLCARCDEVEPVDGVYVILKTETDAAKLHFCSYACQERFVRAAHAVQELPNAW